MQYRYVFFEKVVYNGIWGNKAPERSWGIFENFCVKGNLTDCKFTFNCKLQKKFGEENILVATPIIFLGGEQLHFLSAVTISNDKQYYGFCLKLHNKLYFLAQYSVLKR